MVVHTCNPSSWEAETGGSLVEVQPQLHNKNLKKKQGLGYSSWLERLLHIYTMCKAQGSIPSTGKQKNEVRFL
jgi:hypothetical protein